MSFTSIFNDVLGPVMRGPSSSHTAGSYRIGRALRSLIGETPRSVKISFDPSGSYAQTYEQQGVDLGFAAGLMGWEITDPRFDRSLTIAERKGLNLRFDVRPLERSPHPNTAHVEAVSLSGRRITAEAQAVGGGAFLISRIDDWEVDIDGKTYELLVECEDGAAPALSAEIDASLPGSEQLPPVARGFNRLLRFRSAEEIRPETVRDLEGRPGVFGAWLVHPAYFTQKGTELFRSGEEMLRLAEERRLSLGRIGCLYEAQVLGLSQEEARIEMLRRFDIMRKAVEDGLDDGRIDMLLLEPTASKIMAAESRGDLPTGGLHTRAAARAVAALHTSNSRGVVCAAPTGASSGVLPAVIVTLAEEKGMEEEAVASALFAASAVGLIVAKRATFAAEIAGCQVEIGAAGAMAAAAVVEAAGGTAVQAADAAAISFQNTMGSVCDLVQGICEIPCHTRNAVSASSAFVCADLILGGYRNPVNLDETVDAVYSSGRMLPSELRVTARGGLALAPSARNLARRK